MRPLIGSIILVASVVTAGCTGSSSSSAPTNPATPSSPAVSTSLTGTWTGTAADSTGTMMGAGLSGPMMGNMTWQLTQTGNAFTGVMLFAGYAGMGMTVSGTFNGKTATFTMTMPNGPMMTATCTAVANGSFEMDDLVNRMQGTYAGTNSCTGPFDHGQVSMVHR